MAHVIEDYGAACRYLSGLKAHGVALGLSRMERLVEAVGHPERNVPCIHVAGTNGKGSVAAMLERIFRHAGWSTGLYTSPHLVRLGERVQVNRQILSEEEIIAYVRELQPVVETFAQQGAGVPTYFELMTAMALLHFSRQRCDIACIEVGLGGRLDATNVVTPEVSVITSIGLDHCEVLGSTLAAIAAEKAGIIKPGRPVVIGRLPQEAEHVIREIARQREARVVSVTEHFGDELERYPVTNLEGGYQRWNAATATLVARTLPPFWKLDAQITSEALLQIAWAGRWQRFSVGGRNIILDTSHNAEGAEVLDRNLTQLVGTTGRAPILVGGAVGLARAQALVPVFCRHAREIHFVIPDQGRACRFEELEALVTPEFHGLTTRATVEQLFPANGQCAVGEVGDNIVVTGSIYLVGEVLARLEPQRGASEGHLQDF